MWCLGVDVKAWLVFGATRVTEAHSRSLHSVGQRPRGRAGLGGGFQPATGSHKGFHGKGSQPRSAGWEGARQRRQQEGEDPPSLPFRKRSGSSSIKK